MTRNVSMNNLLRRFISLSIGLMLLTGCAVPMTPTLVATPSAAPAQSTSISAIVSPSPVPSPIPTRVASTTAPRSFAGTYPVGQYGLQVQLEADGSTVLHTPATHLLKMADWKGNWALQDNGAVITITASAAGKPLIDIPAIKVGVVSDTLQVTAFGVNGDFYDRSE